MIFASSFSEHGKAKIFIILQLKSSVYFQRKVFKKRYKSIPYILLILKIPNKFYDASECVKEEEMLRE